MTETERIERDRLMPIAVMEHHAMTDPVLSPYTICDRLNQIWPEVERDAEANTFALDPESVLDVNARVARSLGADVGAFRNPDRWASFVGELTDLGGIDEDPSHTCSWIFSALYWDHLSQFKLATAWFFVNAIRIQHRLPEYWLTLDRLGPFLGDLSGAGPPTYDGQTFSPERYSA